MSLIGFAETPPSCEVACRRTRGRERPSFARDSTRDTGTTQCNHYHLIGHVRPEVGRNKAPVAGSREHGTARRTQSGDGAGVQAKRGHRRFVLCVTTSLSAFNSPEGGARVPHPERPGKVQTHTKHAVSRLHFHLDFAFPRTRAHPSVSPASTISARSVGETARA